MDALNREMEQRVWERVSGGSRENRPSLRTMELRCRESAAVFHRLAGESSGHTREMLQRLRQEEQANAMTILGMRIMTGESPERRSGSMELGTSRSRALAQAFRHSQQARADYAAWGQDEEYGPIFRQMAQEEGKRMGTILALTAAGR